MSFLSATYDRLGTTYELFKDWPEEHNINVYILKPQDAGVMSTYLELLLRMTEAVNNLGLRKHVGNKGYSAIKQYINSQGEFNKQKLNEYKWHLT